MIKGFFFSSVFLILLQSHLLHPPYLIVIFYNCFNPHCHPDSKWMVLDHEVMCDLLLSADLGEMFLNML